MPCVGSNRALSNNFRKAGRLYRKPSVFWPRLSTASIVCTFYEQHTLKMASFVQDLWESIFTPGPTPTLLVATNASFAALQFLLLILLIATYSVHFVVLSALCGGLWYSINWFAAEIAREQQAQQAKVIKQKSPEPENASDTDTETEAPAPETTAATTTSSAPVSGQSHERPKQTSPTLLEPKMAESVEAVRRRRSLGESSGYVSTDSEWEKVSEGDDKTK